MKTITSRDNTLYKDLKRLSVNSQARRKAGRTLLDGVHLCDAYLRRGGMPLLCVVAESSQAVPEVQAVTAQCQSRRVQTLSLPDALYNPLSQVENGIGLFFLIDVPQPAPKTTLMQDAVLLDRVQDPGNLGSILRSAAAAGIAEIHCSPGTALAWSPRVLRAGMGAHFSLEIFENADLGALFGASRLPVMATSPHATVTIYDADLRPPLIWLFGHEGQGVSDELMARASQTLVIPHPGEAESLNVAASVAVCLFEQVRQRR